MNRQMQTEWNHFLYKTVSTVGRNLARSELHCGDFHSKCTDNRFCNALWRQKLSVFIHIKESTTRGHPLIKARESVGPIVERCNWINESRMSVWQWMFFWTQSWLLCAVPYNALFWDVSLLFSSSLDLFICLWGMVSLVARALDWESGKMRSNLACTIKQNTLSHFLHLQTEMYIVDLLAEVDFVSYFRPMIYISCIFLIHFCNISHLQAGWKAERYPYSLQSHCSTGGGG